MRGNRKLDGYCLQAVFIRLLKEHGVSIPEVARATGVHENTLRGWASDKRNKNGELSDKKHMIKYAEDALKVAKFFNISRDDLEFGSSEDRTAQAELDKLRAELRKKEFEQATNQLAIDEYIQTIKAQKEEIRELKNKIAG